MEFMEVRYVTKEVRLLFEYDRWANERVLRAVSALEATLIKWSRRR